MKTKKRHFMGSNQLEHLNTKSDRLIRNLKNSLLTEIEFSLPMKSAEEFTVQNYVRLKEVSH